MGNYHVALLQESYKGHTYNGAYHVHRQSGTMDEEGFKR